MKVALTCPASLPATQFGGILFLGVHIAEKLSTRGIEITIYTTDLDFAKDVNHFNPKMPRIEQMSGFTIKRSHVFFKIKLFFVNPGIYRQIKNDNPDIIHAIGIRGFQALASALFAKFNHKPLVISDQGGLYSHPDYRTGIGKLLYKIQEPAIRFIVNQANRIIVANEYERSLFLKYCDASKTFIIENGIDFENLQKIPFDFKAKYKIKNRFLLFLGRFNKVKGIDTLIDAFSLVCKKTDLEDVILVIMGSDFGYKKQMIEQIKREKIEHRVIVIEKPLRDEVISAYHACKFLVLPSRWEMSPLTHLEGFACKKTVVSTNVFGIPGVVQNGNNGILVDPGEPTQLSEAISTLLHDEDMLETFGKNGWDFVRMNCTSDRMAEKVLNVYNSVLNKN